MHNLIVTSVLQAGLIRKIVILTPENLGHVEFSRPFAGHAGRPFGDVCTYRVGWGVLDHMVEPMPSDFPRQIGQCSDTDLMAPRPEAVSKREQGAKVTDRLAG